MACPKKIYDILAIMFFSFCITSCSDDYRYETLRKRCEETPCTDNQCLHWDSIVKRCGTDSALLQEVKRISPDEYERRLNTIDSARSLQLNIIEKRIIRTDSLSSLLTKKLQEQQKKDLIVDDLINKINYLQFCESIKKCASTFCWQSTLLASAICH